MRALAIDTVTEMCSVALSVDGACLERRELAVNRHSGIVLGMVESLLAEAGIALQALDLIIDDVGPGSFTGIRIGMGVAQGLAYGVDLPLLGVDSLASLAEGARMDTDTPIFAAIDARMGQIYYARFEVTDDGLRCEDGLCLSDPGALEPRSGPVYALGSGWDAYQALLAERLEVTGSASGRFPQAADGLRHGLTLDRSNWVEAGALLPVYLRNEVAKVSNKSLV